MTVYFINESENTVIAELGNDRIKINNENQIKVECETNQMRFNCYLDEKSAFKFMPLSKSVIIEYNFVLNSLYNLTFDNDECEVKFVPKQIKGNNLDCYKFIDLQISNGNINGKEFSVLDESSAKQQLIAARKKEIKLENKLKVIDILHSVCYVGIPGLIIFFGLWYYVDLKTALYVVIPLIIVATAIGLILKKVINRFNNKLDKFNSKFEKGTDKFVDFNSFFDKNYILSVLNNEKNN